MHVLMQGKGGKVKRKGRKEKVTAEMKRAARKAREEKREEKAAAARKDREEIFEVGDEGMSLVQLAEAIQVSYAFQRADLRSVVRFVGWQACYPVHMSVWRVAISCRAS